MKIQKQQLLEALEAVLPVTHPNPVLPITAMVLFAEEWVWATNLESSLAVKNDTGITGVAVPAETAKFLRLCGEEVDVEIVTSGASITMKVVSGILKATFECESLDKAPRMPSFQDGTDYLPDLKILAQFLDKEDQSTMRYMFIEDGVAYSSDGRNMVSHSFGGHGDFHIGLSQAKLATSTSMIKYLATTCDVFMSNGTVFMHTGFDASRHKVGYKNLLEHYITKSSGTVSCGNISDVKKISDLSMSFPHLTVIHVDSGRCLAMSHDGRFNMEVEWDLELPDCKVSMNASSLKIASTMCEKVHSGIDATIKGITFPVLLFENDKYKFLIFAGHVSE